MWYWLRWRSPRSPSGGRRSRWSSGRRLRPPTVLCWPVTTRISSPGGGTMPAAGGPTVRRWWWTDRGQPWLDLASRAHLLSPLAWYRREPTPSYLVRLGHRPGICRDAGARSGGSTGAVVAARSQHRHGGCRRGRRHGRVHAASHFGRDAGRATRVSLGGIGRLDHRLCRYR